MCSTAEQKHYCPVCVLFLNTVLYN